MSNSPATTPSSMTKDAEEAMGTPKSGLLLLLIALLTQSIVVLLLLWRYPTLAIIVHALGVGIMIVLSLKANSPQSRLIIILTLFGGIFGTIALVIALLMERRMIRKPRMAIADWLDRFLEVETPSHRLMRNLYEGRENQDYHNDIQPLHTVFLHGTTLQKRRILNQISNHYRSAFSPVLQLALQDADNGIRVYAASIIAQVEHTFTTHIIPLERQMERSPNNPTLMLKLATEYDDYAYSGVVDSARAQELRERALHLLEDYRNHMGKDLPPRTYEDICRRIARLALRLNRPRMAETLLRPLVEERLHDMPGGLLLWYLESLYNQGKYAAVREACQRYGDALNPASLQIERARQTLHTWSAIKSPLKVSAEGNAGL